MSYKGEKGFDTIYKNLRRKNPEWPEYKLQSKSREIWVNLYSKVLKTMSFKPMLAAPSEFEDVRYPCLASGKLDGVRAVIINGVVYSRSLKKIPNHHVQKLFGKKRYNGLDGELIVGDPTDEKVFQVTTSGVMSHDGEPHVKFYTFDDFTHPENPFKTRHDNLKELLKILKNPRIILVEHEKVSCESDLRKLMDSYIAKGYEGMMIRDPYGVYKYGRSTVNQGWLLKMKIFQDSEAEVLGTTELMVNQNEAEVDNLGHKTRSTKKAGKVPGGTLGALVVRDVKTKVEFDIGTGFTQRDRDNLWEARESIVGSVVKYRFQPSGVKNKPRFPSFLGFRSKIDM